MNSIAMARTTIRTKTWILQNPSSAMVPVHHAELKKHRLLEQTLSSPYDSSTGNTTFLQEDVCICVCVCVYSIATAKLQY